MRFVIQRVTSASVTVEGEVTGKIDKGLLVFVGVSSSDTEEIATKMVDKLVKMRIFEDENGKTNLALSDVGGKLLMVSQFTLYANCRRGNRPSFTDAGAPEMANDLYEFCMSQARKAGFEVQHGIFGADMKVDIHNDGPFTIILDSDELNI